MSLSGKISDMVRTTINRELDRVLPGLVVGHLKKRFKDEPNKPLSAVGFTWAFALEIQRWWPNVPHKTAAEWLREYLDVPFGSDGYIWTAAAAEELAREYISECGG